VSLRDSFDMDGRAAVVTGAGRGIGQAIAWGLADFGCDVVVNARRLADLEATAEGIRGRGRRAPVVDGDIRDFPGTLARMGEPDGITAAVAYPASDKASWVTGRLIMVAGGRTHRTTSYQRRDDQ
jgi:NAD(P)-dependent dehydrogenase (short-subunit alcohol dehydrogenase family)